MLKIRGACKSFNGVKILDDVSFDAAKGGVLGLAGPSGSGKSTLLRCVQKLETLDEGTIEYDGKTGFMFQDFQLFPHMTIMRNLLYAPSLKDKKKNHEKRARKILKDLGIEAKAEEYPNSLSGGQKQRAALARTLMIDPDLLLCDEPTSGLDVATIEDVILLLKSVNKTGVAMVIASHDLDFLTKISDRIILLKEGRINADVDLLKCNVIHFSNNDPIEYLKQYY
ncbi:MAG: ATP-binding cassette domain-containing protein [Holosporaceae bacterium]|jgi:polar amino acid transport system ATP-binding protein|nr:ATP-binding cassette domain-containing protein [Holosporaceae bacterium]